MLGSGQMAENIIVLIRNIVIARILGPENFGIAASFMLIVSIFSMISDVGVENYLLRAGTRHLSRLQSTLYSILILRGLSSAILIFILAEQFSILFGRPYLLDFYASAALLPAIGAFKHLDPLRRQRDLKYSTMVVVQIGSLLPGTIVAIVVAIFTQSYVAVAWGNVISVALSVLLSHVLASEPYRPTFEIGIVRQILSYGWPLMLNGGVIFLTNQGDRIIVGTLEGFVDLAGYVAIGSVTVGISLILMKFTGALYVPILSAVRSDAASVERRNQICGVITVILTFLIFLPMIFLAAPLVSLLYGPEYQVPIALAGWASIQSAARVIRSWPAALALTLGFTRDILYANLIRLSGLVACIASVLFDFGMVGIAAGVAIAEVVATLFSLWRASGIVYAEERVGILYSAIFCVLFTSAFGVSLFYLSPDEVYERIIASVLFSGVGVVFALMVSYEVRRRVFLLIMRGIEAIRK